MNWRRGLIRLWLAVSVSWTLGVAWFGYQQWHFNRQIIRDEGLCADARRSNPSLGNPFECFSTIQSEASIILEYSAMALGPAIGLLIEGITAKWVIAGCRNEA